MHEAASLGQAEKLQLLVDNGASVNTMTVDNMTPLHDACIQDHPQCVRVLLNAGAQVKCRLFSLVITSYHCYYNVKLKISRRFTPRALLLEE